MRRTGPNARTLEHLVARANKGSDDPANIALAHRLCNNRAGNLSLAEKYALRRRIQSRPAATIWIDTPS